MIDFITSKQIVEGTIVRITSFTLNNVQNQVVLIIHTLEPVGSASKNNFPNPPSTHINNMVPSYQSVQPSSAPVAPTSYNPPPAYQAYNGQSNSRPVIRDSSATSFTPIDQLNPYANKWTIKARISNKSDIRSWNNAKGSGTLFSIDLIDNKGSEIRGTFFKDACDKFYPLLQQGMVYTLTGGQLKVVANKQYSNIKNDYEITFDLRSDIQPFGEDTSIKSVNYNFTKLDKISSATINSTVDVIGIVMSARDIQTLVGKQSGKELIKRDVTVRDETFQVSITLWGDKAKSDNWNEGDIVAFKGLKVGEYQGTISLSSSASSTMNFLPDCPEGAALHQFYHANKGNLPAVQSLSGGGSSYDKNSILPVEKRTLLSDVEHLGHNEKPDWVTFKAILNKFYNTNSWYYPSCLNADCKKKVVESGNSWNCEKCGVSHPEPRYRYVLTGSVLDHSGSHRMSLFDDQGKMLLKCSADEFHAARSADETAIESYKNNCLWNQYIVKGTVKIEMVNDKPSVKVSVQQLTPVDYVTESAALIEAIKKYN